MQFENVQETGKCMNENMQEYARADCISLHIFSQYTQYKNTPLPFLPSPPPKKRGGGEGIESTEPLQLCEFFPKKSAYENQKMFMNKLFYGKHQLE